MGRTLKSVRFGTRLRGFGSHNLNGTVENPETLADEEMHTIVPRPSAVEPVSLDNGDWGRQGFFALCLCEIVPMEMLEPNYPSYPWTELQGKLLTFRSSIP